VDKRVQPLARAVLRVLVAVAVPIQGERNGTMSGPDRDVLEVVPSGHPERDRRMAQVVDAQGLQAS
jgi:hypothetical protein